MENTTLPQTARRTLEQAAYLAVGGLALLVRLMALGRHPLGAAEAARAWTALTWHWGAPLGDAPLYTLWTAAAFFLFGAADAVARLVPALAGAALVALPWAWRERLGRPIALLVALFLALDPTLVALSRQAGGATLGLLGVLGGTTLLLRRSPWGWAGLLLGLLAGRSAWFGLLVLVLSGVVWHRLHRSLARPAPAEGSPAWLPGLAALLGATLLGVAPGGVGGLFVGALDLLRGWLPTADGVAPGWAWLWGGGLNPWLVGLALWGGLRAWRAEAPAWQRGAVIWAGLAWLLAGLYPARTAAEAAWVLPPLQALAAATALQVLPGPIPPVAWGMAGLLAFLGAYLWLLLVNLSGVGGLGGLAWPLPLVVLLGVGVMALAVLLVRLGWSPTVARQGLAWGLTLLLVPLSLRSLGWAVAAPPWQNPWAVAPAGPGVRLLQQTVAQVAEMRTGHPAYLEVLLLDPAPTVRWALRGVRGAQAVTVLPPQALPDALVTSGTVTDLGLGVAYRGQDFLLEIPPLAQRVPEGGWARWFLRGEVPLTGARFILWVRTDVFPGGVLQEAQPLNP